MPARSGLYAVDHDEQRCITACPNGQVALPDRELCRQEGREASGVREDLFAIGQIFW